MFVRRQHRSSQYFVCGTWPKLYEFGVHRQLSGAPTGSELRWMVTGKPARAHNSPKPGDMPPRDSLGGEIAAWSAEFRCRWFRDHEANPMSWWLRLAMAFAGTVTYLLGFGILVAARNPVELTNILTTSNFVVDTTMAFLALAVCVAFSAALSAWMTTWRDSAAGPIRTFLAGVALPATVVLFVRISYLLF